jgi:hypothetical protein
MKRLTLSLGLTLVTAAVGGAEPAPPVSKASVVKDAWDAAYLEGAKVGYFRTLVREVERDEARVLRATVFMDLAIKRYNAVVPLRMRVGTDETPAGKVVALSLTQFLDGGKQMTQTARVADGKLLVKTDEGEKEVAWDDSVIGQYRQEKIFRDKKVQPGDTFSYRNYELSLLSPVTVKVEVKEPELVDLLVPGKEGAKAERVKRKLLRVEAVPEKVKVGTQAIQLPRMVAWLDEQRDMVRSEMEMAGLGKITLYRTTKAIAQEEGAAPSLLPDLGLTTLIPLDQPIPKAHQARSIVYRVTLKGDEDASTAFEKDARQQVKNVEGSSFDLYVRAVRQPRPREDAPRADPQFLKSSYFLDSKDELVRKYAAEAVESETDAWKKARQIERWVHEHMKPNSAIGFLTAGQVARDLQGDCRQHAMLTAAMCRAAAVPARTAIGLVYVEDAKRGPVLGFHMWTEVWVEGQWLALDATLGRGSVGPAHLKISSPSWNDTQTLAPLLPVTRVMGKMKVEVVRVRP